MNTLWTPSAAELWHMPTQPALFEEKIGFDFFIHVFIERHNSSRF